MFVCLFGLRTCYCSDGVLGLLVRCWCVVGVADVGVVVGSVGVGLLDLLMVCVLVGWFTLFLFLGG